MRTTSTKNPGGQAGVSILPYMQKALQFRYTPLERQAQFIARRFSLPLSSARCVASLAFGDGSHE